MIPPPYVHHFDSYSMVKQLQGGGYTDDQSIEVMKGIRSLLAQNLDVAQQSLVSKSDVENVSIVSQHNMIRVLTGTIGVISVSSSVLGAETRD